MTNEVENITYVYGDVCLRKQRRKRQKLLILDLFLDYAKNSTLHGLRYITEKGLTTIEKLFWISTFVISVIFCSFLIKNVYVKWKTSPVIVTVSERLVSVGEVPFPSVTICPQIKCKATVYNFSAETDSHSADYYNESLHGELAKYGDISMVCGFPYMAMKYHRNYTNASIIDNIDKVAPTSEDVFIFCYWRKSPANCTKMFKKVYTAEGLCFNMNGLAAEEMFRETVQMDYKYSERDELMNGWSLEEDYSSTDKISFPERGSENSARPDLVVTLQNRAEDSDALCNVVNSGYKIYIQHPADFPQSSLYYYAALDRQVSSLAISFNVLSTSDTLENYAPETRQCYFPADRQLYYFKIYTAKNCRAECLSNYTFKECGCVGYYMPHDNSSQICAENKLWCMEDAHDNMVNEELRLELAKNATGCRCLPACNSVEYDAEILKTEFHFKRFMRSIKEIYHIDFDNTTNYSKIEMYFKKPHFVSMRRSELFGLTDFLANIGGLLGVFLGFSFLSFIEILYFITLRVGCTLKRDLKDEKKTRTNSFKLEKEK
ncbi:Gonad-specific amiloride-sensitive sodium channel 1 [Operophtera brumata]|uniref:Gonad-specific amiloride-sensitive sodium channel 1 n=1 Tax=Operophtera brumata TaxID=104452 RepID=A0A0L7LLW2_OPEBR|nr:Gonad-specific amiloride-sensitive sodium channel 1 [Operophtera brumata]